MFDAHVMETLKSTSRTFFLPIMRLDGELRDTVAAYYLANRALDQIEDHPRLTPEAKIALLGGVSRLLQEEAFTEGQVDRLFHPFRDRLEPVTLRFHEWAVQLPPRDVAPRLWDSLATLADRMAEWVRADFRIDDESDLDRYTFAVASSIGITLSDLWSRYASVVTRFPEAVAFGRAVQAANIAWNHEDDLSRGVDFFPAGWTTDDMCRYARRHLPAAEAYAASLPAGPIRDFCSLTLDIFRATLSALQEGSPLDRKTVTALADRYAVSD
ncbi:squalene/phytoene synthase family protein [Streptomyces sp. TRM66268-LWL]|uniref:Squalene/phytoene synthase family protein n=1 Tax=Streptomyces polyasparticus TaxID=2767826 RepID=A0ABR7SBV7_9ACTN|nr:squalene/phytoene synthase family protein [Streptomyces polyasparticus]MBC9712654.1 squalene/phytoene synthase family protein [Streptomyces polyasparticus]